MAAVLPTSSPMDILLLRGMQQVLQAVCSPRELHWVRLAPCLTPTLPEVPPHRLGQHSQGTSSNMGGCSPVPEAGGYKAAL